MGVYVKTDARVDTVLGKLGGGALLLLMCRGLFGACLSGSLLIHLIMSPLTSIPKAEMSPKICFNLSGFTENDLYY